MASKGRKRAKAKPKPRLGRMERFLRGLLARIFRLVWWVGLRGAILAAIVLAVSTAYYVSQIPDYEELLDGRSGGSVTLLDRNG